ncbi:MAG: glycerophosphoryl diester phosphodiesterase membrane domain-containing protein [Clostridium sp.]|uniref:glycerophosphoryl diester phosphodiesterase membrane domain-containing protein n=1 Tax=Clostridium sp. TaxID=1506 RepID=UPI00305C2076
MDIHVESRKLIRETYKNFRYNFKSVIFFEVLYKLLAMFIFIPINYLILSKFMSDIGVYNITNKDLLKFGLTPAGVMYISLIVLVSFIAVFMETGILTYMANKSHKQESVSLLEGTVNSIKIIPKAPSLYMVWLVLISAVIGPLTGIGLYNSLIRTLTIPSFIKMELFKSLGGKIFFVVAIIIMIILLLRWILSIPAMVIEEVSLKKAFKSSIKIYKESKFKILGYLISWTIVNYCIKLILLGGFMGIGTIVLSMLKNIGILGWIATVVMLIIFFCGYIIIDVLTLPLFISFLIEIYYRYRNYDVKERSFTPLSYFEERGIYKFFIKNSNKIIIVTVVIFGIMASGIGASAIFNEVVEKEIKITAHRGSSLKAPENSISALKQAIEDGADYAEIDVMTTKENELVLFHDSTLKRIDGTSRSIGDMTLEEINTVDNGSYFSSEFKDEKIPTLKEIISIAKGKIKLNIELKPRNSEDLLSQYVAKLITDEQMEDEVVISSLDYDNIQQVKAYNPLIEVGYILTFGVGDFTKLDVDFVSVEYQMLKRELVYGMHAIGKKVHVWTINDEERAINAIRLGADNIITDSIETIESVSNNLKENKDVDYLTWLFDAINSIIKHVNI